MQIAFLRGASSLPFVFLSYAVTGDWRSCGRALPMHVTRAVLVDPDALVLRVGARAR